MTRASTPRPSWRWASTAALLGALAAAGCAPPEADAPVEAPEEVATGTVNPGPGLEADPSAPPVQAADPTSPEAAVDRLLAYLGAHSEGAAGADSLWGPGGLPASVDADLEPFRLPDVSVLSATVDEPSRPEGAAGSVYLVVPATLTVQTDDGTTAVPLRYTLRRTNDVPGAAPWSLRWHLEAVAKG